MAAQVPAAYRGAGMPPSAGDWLAQVCRAVVEIDDEQQVLRLVAEAICGVSGWGACVVSIPDAEGLLHARATAGVSAAADKQLRNRPVAREIYRRLWEAGTPAGPARVVPVDHPLFREPAVLGCLVNAHEPDSITTAATDRGRRPLVLIPLQDAARELVGFINVDVPPEDAGIGGQLASHWSVLADLAVAAMALAAARATARSQGYLTEGLLHATAGVRSSLQLDEVLADIAAAMTATGGFHRVGINLLDEAGILHTQATAGMPEADAARLRATPTSISAMGPLMRPQMRVSRSYVFDHRYFDCPPELLALLSVPDHGPSDADAPQDAADRWHPLDSMTVPLYDQRGALIGIISADEPWDGKFPDLAHIQALEFFADQAAVAIGQARQHEQLAAQARTDPLTGVANRQVLLEALRRTLTDVGRAGTPCAVLFCDLDHFKIVNDRYGHPVGDQALQAVANALAGRVRARDLLARYGGEEFVILAPDTDAEAACALAEQLRSRVAALGEPELPPGLTVHISIGVAISAPSRPMVAADSLQQAIDELLITADQAMYEAKRHGRDQVRLAGQL